VALSRRAPKTYGDLRKLLRDLGDPWRPDPTVSDDEPLPDYPTGGDGRYEPSDRVLPDDGVNAVLERSPPANPALREVWREEGLLPEADSTRAPARPKRSRRKTTPPPDDGG
jgi:hypothetical protein